MFTTESIKCVIFFWLKERAEENVYVTHNVSGNEILFG